MALGVIAVLGRAYKANQYENVARVAVQRMLSSQTDVAKLRDEIQNDVTLDLRRIDEKLDAIMEETHRAIDLTESTLPKLVRETRGGLSRS